MDVNTNLVLAIVAGVLIAKLIGFVGTHMYQVIVMMLEDESTGSSGILILVIGGLGWLGTIVGGMWLYAQVHRH